MGRSGTQVVLLRLTAIAWLTMASARRAGPDGEVPPSPQPVCLPDPQPLPAPEYLGLSLASARRRAGEDGVELRVVGEDGRCFDHDADLRSARVNVELASGVVIAAARF